MSFIAIDYNKCVGCKNCEFSCAFHNNGNCNTVFSSIKVDVYPADYLSLPSTCMHCEDAWCMNICPRGAISRDEELGGVVVDKRLCAGCKSCIITCPFGNMHFDKLNKTVFKCDLCGGNPQCVKHCIAGALTYCKDNNYDEIKRDSMHKKLSQLLKSREFINREGC